jgi:hypothetical protein
MRRKLSILAVSAATLAALLALPGGAGAQADPGFHTSEAAMLTGVGGTTVSPIISVGDTLAGGYLFEAIPDGISIGRINGRGTVDILVNHELSLVPFPATRQDPINSVVSKLRLHQRGGGVLKGEYAIPSSAGYQRFCSNFVGGKEHGFSGGCSSPTRRPATSCCARRTRGTSRACS